VSNPTILRAERDPSSIRISSLKYLLEALGIAWEDRIEALGMEHCPTCHRRMEDSDAGS